MYRTAFHLNWIGWNVNIQTHTIDKERISHHEKCGSTLASHTITICTLCHLAFPPHSGLVIRESISRLRVNLSTCFCQYSAPTPAKECEFTLHESICTFFIVFSFLSFFLLNLTKRTQYYTSSEHSSELGTFLSHRFCCFFKCWCWNYRGVNTLTIMVSVLFTPQWNPVLFHFIRRPQKGIKNELKYCINQNQQS